LPFEYRTGSHAFCPRQNPKRGSLSPRGSRSEASNPCAMRKAVSQARMAGIRRHWRLAKALSPSLTEAEQKGWFMATDHFDDVHDPLQRIRHLIGIRKYFKQQQVGLMVLRIDAAIWQDIGRLKNERAAKPGPRIRPH